jgi:hypothetical protein
LHLLLSDKFIAEKLVQVRDFLKHFLVRDPGQNNRMAYYREIHEAELIKNICQLSIQALRVRRPDRSRQSSEWIWPSPLTDIRTVGCARS